MSRKGYINLSIILMFASAIMISLAFVYYALEDRAISYRYSDIKEYTDINNGIKFIEKMPIQFNIINKYFSNMNNLSQKEKEEIVLAYALKNGYRQFDCGPSTSTIKYNCVKVEDINDRNFQKVFNLDLTFENEVIDLYMDDYGTQELTNKENKDIYKYVVDITNNSNYRLYTKFDRFNQSDDKYVFYVYQGYINANTKAGDTLTVYDFMTGKPVISGTSNGYNDFNEEITKENLVLQKYKYELKKHDDGSYYLYAYNPVKS